MKSVWQLGRQVCQATTQLCFSEMTSMSMVPAHNEQQGQYTCVQTTLLARCGSGRRKFESLASNAGAWCGECMDLRNSAVMALT